MRPLRSVFWALALAAACLSAPLSAAQPKEAQGATSSASDVSWADRLVRHTGAIDLAAAKARLMLGDDYYFLDAADSRKVLVDGWRNPPEAVDGVLGMIFPKRFSPLDDGAWGAVITYEQTGYVADKDAKSADYDKLLEELRKGEAQENKDRTKAGFPTAHLAGWAERPAYDAATHTVIWAKDIDFGGKPFHTLNYDIRVLGRRGVISLNVVAGMPDLPEVRAAAGRIAQVAVYNSGERYADHAWGDKKAAYGVAGLIAAGVGAVALKKVGLLAVLLAFGKKAIVLVVAGFAALAAWVRRLFGMKPKSALVGSGNAPPPTPPPSGGDIVT